MFRGGVIAIEPTEQHLGGGAPDGGWVLSDDGDAWLQQIGEQDIVETDQGNALMKSHAPKRPECADGDQVLTGEESGGGVRQPEQLGRSRLRLLDSSQVEPHEPFIDLNLLTGQLLHVAAMPFRSSRDRTHVAEEPDTAV